MTTFYKGTQAEFDNCQPDPQGLYFIDDKIYKNRTIIANTKDFSFSDNVDFVPIIESITKYNQNIISEIKKDKVLKWKSCSISTTSRIVGICRSPSLIVVVTATGEIFTSPDGETWTKQTSPVTVISDIVYAHELGMFVAAGQTSTSTTTACTIYSYNGIDWTAGTSVKPTYIAYSPELQMFLCTNTPASTYYSIDGINWTNAIMSPSSSASCSCIYWCKEQGMFIFNIGNYTYLFNGTDSSSFSQTTGPTFKAYCWSPHLQKLLAITSTSGIYYYDENKASNRWVSLLSLSWQSGGNKSSYDFIYSSEQELYMVAQETGIINISSSPGVETSWERNAINFSWTQTNKLFYDMVNHCWYVGGASGLLAKSI